MNKGVRMLDHEETLKMIAGVLASYHDSDEASDGELLDMVCELLHGVGMLHEVSARCGGAARIATNHEPFPQPLFEQFDPLRHRRRGDMQHPCRTLETALAHHGRSHRPRWRAPLG